MKKFTLTSILMVLLLVFFSGCSKSLDAERRGYWNMRSKEEKVEAIKSWERVALQELSDVKKGDTETFLRLLSNSPGTPDAETAVKEKVAAVAETFDQAMEVFVFVCRKDEDGCGSRSNPIVCKSTIRQASLVVLLDKVTSLHQIKSIWRVVTHWSDGELRVKEEYSWAETEILERWMQIFTKFVSQVKTTDELIRAEKLRPLKGKYRGEADLLIEGRIPHVVGSYDDAMKLWSGFGFEKSNSSIPGELQILEERIEHSSTVEEAKEDVKDSFCELLKKARAKLKILEEKK